MNWLSLSAIWDEARTFLVGDLVFCPINNKAFVAIKMGAGKSHAIYGTGHRALIVQMLTRRSSPHSSGVWLLACELSDPILFLFMISSRFATSSGLLEE